MTTASMQQFLTRQRVLLLQGKMGWFFDKFAKFLKNRGMNVCKINFNAGDAFFYKQTNSYEYTHSVEEFPEWLINFIKAHKIEAVVCFADCRPHHVVAAEICEQLNIDFFVFEEGYLRPDYITFEKFGINANSRLSLDELPKSVKPYKQPLPTDNRFYKLCYVTFIYYFLSYIYRNKYPHYRHYRGISELKELGKWLKAPYKKAAFYIPDKIFLRKHLLKNLNNQYFLVCLQVHNDTQITHHSDYDDVKDFIIEVLNSFAKHANSKHALVIKHHPLDRGHRDYRSFIKKLAKSLGMADRVYYGCDMHLPTMIKHSLGSVVVNSTTGLQSIYHQKPTKVTGRSLYDMEGLTDQKSLDEFWQNPQKPNRDFYLKFRQHLINQNQLNGSFFGLSPWMDNY